MELIRVLLLLIYFLIQATCAPYPGGSHHHIHHRIHVPHKIKTIYHTKIIKVPEHHHYFHEKEKIIQVEAPKKEHPQHHHYFHEKEKIIQVEAPKEEHPIYPPLKEEDLSDFSDFDNHEYYGESRHNVQKRRPPSLPKKLKKRKIFRERY